MRRKNRNFSRGEQSPLGCGGGGVDLAAVEAL